MPDAIVLLKADHKEAERLFKRFESLGPGARKSKRVLVDEIIVELSRHAAVEEQVFYPAIREALPAIDDDVLEGLEEHHIVKWTLSELQDLSPDEERFDAKVTVLIESVRHHVKEEETEMFPAVRAALGRKRLLEIGTQLEQAKKVVPSRPHPKAPDTPPGNLVVGNGAGLAERARKAFSRL